jgi:uncharacterized membrane protein YgcG
MNQNERAPRQNHPDCQSDQESFADYRAITLDLHNINHGISNHMFRTFKKQYTAMMFNFFKRNLFKAALTPELRAMVAQRDPEAMTVKKMYMVATTAQREGKAKSPAAVNEISEEDIPVEAMDDENDVAAFNCRGAQLKTNQSGNQNRGGYASGQGGYQIGSGFNKQGGSSGGSRNNTNQNNKYCYFCKQQGH